MVCETLLRGLSGEQHGRVGLSARRMPAQLGPAFCWHRCSLHPGLPSLQLCRRWGCSETARKDLCVWVQKGPSP